MKKILFITLFLFLTVNTTANQIEIKMVNNSIAKEEVEKIFDGKIILKDKKYYFVKNIPKNVTFGSGNYKVGFDIEEGVYDLEEVSSLGISNLVLNDFEKLISFYEKSDKYKNLKLKKGDSLEITGKISFIKK